MAKLPDVHLLHITKGSAQILNNFRLGVHITQVSGLSIDQLLESAARDRFNFARDALKCARWAFAGRRPQYRVALAGSYYAMYHAARAVVYFVEKGDDHEAHMELPKHLPKDFPDRDQWENEIKTARYERNKADYDPYPRTNGAFKLTAITTFSTAERFLRVGRRYLLRKGCAL